MIKTTYPNYKVPQKTVNLDPKQSNKTVVFQKFSDNQRQLLVQWHVAMLTLLRPQSYRFFH